ncbi:LacI family DNA-binding transcriptional regulator [Amycolatopsis sp. NPDC004378]
MTGKLDDVARHAGVSTATASRALRGLPRVSASTRARVASAAAELGYVISHSASSLASGRTGTVGMVVPYLGRWYFAQIISEVERVLRDAGVSVLLYNIGDNEGRTRFFSALPLKRRVDAVVVLSLPLSDVETDLLLGLDVPVVAVGIEEPGMDCIGIDDHAAALLAMRHLAGLGHREIAFIGEGSPVPLGFTAPVRRLAAFRQVREELGCPADPAFEAGGHFTIAGGERAMSRLLGGTKRPTAVFAASDEMAFGALRALRRAGLRAPHDISVIGFDDHEMSDLLELSTVVQPVAEIGRLTGERVVARLGGDPSSRTSQVDTHLVLRGSTAPPA